MAENMMPDRNSVSVELEAAFTSMNSINDERIEDLRSARKLAQGFLAGVAGFSLPMAAVRYWDVTVKYRLGGMESLEAWAGPTPSSNFAAFAKLDIVRLGLIHRAYHPGSGPRLRRDTGRTG